MTHIDEIQHGSTTYETVSLLDYISNDVADGSGNCFISTNKMDNNNYILTNKVVKNTNYMSTSLNDANLHYVGGLVWQ